MNPSLALTSIERWRLIQRGVMRPSAIPKSQLPTARATNADVDARQPDRRVKRSYVKLSSMTPAQRKAHRQKQFKESAQRRVLRELNTEKQ